MHNLVEQTDAEITLTKCKNYYESDVQIIHRHLRKVTYPWGKMRVGEYQVRFPGRRNVCTEF
jgi:hypothetical protein